MLARSARVTSSEPRGTDSTIATTAMLGQSLLPEMLRRGYHPSMAMGPIMAIGGVDMLIPPSALTVLHSTADAAEGIAAFLAKRPPRFEGR